MIAWLRWPTIWYSTPTFLAFVWAQNVWLDPARPMLAAYLFWGALGVMLDVWATRRHRRAPPETGRRRFAAPLNWLLLPFIVLWLGGVSLRPVPDAGLEFNGVEPSTFLIVSQLLPGIGVTAEPLVRRGLVQVAAHFAMFQLAVVICWSIAWLVLLRMLTSHRWTEPSQRNGPPPSPFQQRAIARSVFTYAAWRFVFAWLVCVGFLVFWWYAPQSGHGELGAFDVVADGQVYILALVPYGAVGLAFAGHWWRAALATHAPALMDPNPE